MRRVPFLGVDDLNGELQLIAVVLSLSSRMVDDRSSSLVGADITSLALR